MKLVLGTVQFGLDYGINNNSGSPDFEEVSRILDAAYEAGISTLDTAEKYGDVHQVIGKYHEQSDNRFEIITKFSFDNKESSHSIVDSVNKYLKDLFVERINCCMFHSFSDLKSNYGKFENDLKLLLDEGKIKRIGVSIYTNEELLKALEYPLISLIQLPFNLLDNHNQRGKVIELAKQKGIEIHTRSVFLQGLFFVSNDKLVDGLKPLSESIIQLKEICSNSNLEMADLALGYVTSQENIDSVLIGVDNLSQLQKNLKALKIEIDSSIFSSVNEIDLENTNLLNPSNWQ